MNIKRSSQAPFYYLNEINRKVEGFIGVKINPGLTEQMGQVPATPKNVELGIQKYKEYVVTDPANAAFYNRNIDLMTQKLNEFNISYTNACGTAQ